MKAGICLMCQTPFEGTRRRRYCKIGCRKLAYWRRHQERLVAERRKAREQANLVERARAAVTLVNSTQGARSPDLEEEAFMGLFHPEKQAARRYMLELKGAVKQ